MTLHIPEHANAHDCMPPDIDTWVHEEPEEPQDPDLWVMHPPKLVDRLPEGTRFHCPCGEVWYVVRIPAGENGYIGWAERHEWKSETNMQRLLRWIREGRS